MRNAVSALAVVLGLLGSACGASATPNLTAADSRYHPARFPATAVGADSVELLAGAPAFAAISSLLAEARRSVHVEMYELQRDDLLGALITAHARGVSVTVIVDPTGIGSAASAARLRSAGVVVIDYPVRARMIDHVKLLVVDSAVAVTGGINWGDGSAANHDFDLLVRGPCVAGLERVFATDLLTSGHLRGVLPPTRPDPDISVLTTLPQAQIRPVLIRLIERARNRIDLELFVITDTGVVHALELASRRGVQVHLLIDPNQHPSDTAAAQLEAAGVPLRRYRSHGEKLHAKAMVVDGDAVAVGSANWTSSGFGHNHELDLVLWHAPVVAAEMRSVMEADWADSAPLA